MNTEYNPYSAPTSVIADQADSQPFAQVSKGRRLGGYLIDHLCFIGISMAIGVFTALVFKEQGIETLQKIPNVVLGCSILLVFYCFFEGIWARTPGKFILGTMVVNAAGERPSFGQIFKRTLCRFIPFDAFSYLGEGRWHDSISKTQVVHVRKA